MLHEIVFIKVFLRHCFCMLNRLRSPGHHCMHTHRPRHTACKLTRAIFTARSEQASKIHGRILKFVQTNVPSWRAAFFSPRIRKRITAAPCASLPKIARQRRSTAPTSTKSTSWFKTAHFLTTPGRRNDLITWMCNAFEQDTYFSTLNTRVTLILTIFHDYFFDTNIMHIKGGWYWNCIQINERHDFSIFN